MPVALSGPNAESPGAPCPAVNPPPRPLFSLDQSSESLSGLYGSESLLSPRPTLTPTFPPAGGLPLVPQGRHALRCLGTWFLLPRPKCSEPSSRQGRLLLVTRVSAPSPRLSRAFVTEPTSPPSVIRFLCRSRPPEAALLPSVLPGERGRSGSVPVTSGPRAQAGTLAPVSHVTESSHQLSILRLLVTFPGQRVTFLERDAGIPPYLTPSGPFATCHAATCHVATALCRPRPPHPLSLPEELSTHLP